jgi:ferredoxin
MKNVKFNELYQQGLERIGCWLCPASDLADFNLSGKSHPDYVKLEKCLKDYSTNHSFSPDWIEYGLWRWKKLPAGIRQLISDKGIEIRINKIQKKQEQERQEQEIQEQDRREQEIQEQEIQEQEIQEQDIQEQDIQEQEIQEQEIQEQEIQEQEIQEQDRRDNQLVQLDKHDKHDQHEQYDKLDKMDQLDRHAQPDQLGQNGQLDQLVRSRQRNQPNDGSKSVNQTEGLTLKLASGFTDCKFGLSVEGVFNKPLDMDRVINLLNILGEPHFDKELGYCTLAQTIDIFPEGGIVVKGRSKKEIRNKAEDLYSVILRAMECIGCGVCVGRCKQKALYVVNEKGLSDFGKLKVLTEKCKHCSKCLGPCPVVNFKIDRGYEM